MKGSSPTPGQRSSRTQNTGSSGNESSEVAAIFKASLSPAELRIYLKKPCKLNECGLCKCHNVVNDTIIGTLVLGLELSVMEDQDNHWDRKPGLHSRTPDFESDLELHSEKQTGPVQFGKEDERTLDEDEGGPANHGSSDSKLTVPRTGWHQSRRPQRHHGRPPAAAHYALPRPCGEHSAVAPAMGGGGAAHLGLATPQLECCRGRDMASPGGRSRRRWSP